MAVNDKDAKLNAWLDALDGDEATTPTPTAAEGPTGEVLRQAMAINPNLFKEKKEAELRTEMEKAQKQSSEKKQLDSSLDHLPQDLTKAILFLEQKFYEEKSSLKMQIAKLQQQERELPARVLDRVIGSVLLQDPNMVSPKTLEILSMKREFLSVVGFSARKVIDKQIADEKKRGK